MLKITFVFIENLMKSMEKVSMISDQGLNTFLF